MEKGREIDREIDREREELERKRERGWREADRQGEAEVIGGSASGELSSLLNQENLRIIVSCQLYTLIITFT